MITLETEIGEETLSLEDFEARVREGRVEPSTRVRFPVLTGDAWVPARELEVFQRLYAPARIHFARAFSLGRFPTVTVLLVVLQLVVFFGMAGSKRALSLDPLIDAGAKAQPNILELGETWRLITANLLHRDVLHVGFNMFFLFNVGGAIENAYRLQEYALILVVSALGTTALSTAMSALPSVGASGMVLGLFGAASVFGYKYSDILPARYRRYFGGAVLPYALFILYVGLATKDTDNWGHLGGLLGGALAAIPIEPRLLRVGRARRPWLAENAALVASAGLLSAVIAAGPLVRAVGPRLTSFEEPESGVRLAQPARWTVGVNHVGYPSWGNALGASLGVRAERHSTKPATLREVRAQFLEVELEKRVVDGDIASVRVLDERPVIFPDARATELRIALESRAGPQLTRNILVERGYYSYVVILSAPAAWAEQYEPLFDALAARLSFVEPEPLAKARLRVSTFPGMSSAHIELGHQLASIGSVKAAAQAYQRALEGLPEHPEALYGLAKLAADYEGDLEDAEQIASGLHEHRPEDPSYAALAADLRQRLGRLDGACAVLEETLDRVQDAPEDLRQRLRALKCRSAGR